MECGGVDLGSAGKGGPTDAAGAACGQVKATSAPGTQGLLYLPSSTSSDVLPTPAPPVLCCQTFANSHVRPGRFNKRARLTQT